MRQADRQTEEKRHKGYRRGESETEIGREIQSAERKEQDKEKKKE